MTTTGQQIRAARERAGLTQGELAQRVGVTLRTVGNWERDEVSPRNRLGRLRQVLPDLGAGDRSATLHSASDAELLAEIARRFERTREDVMGNAKHPAPIAPGVIGREAARVERADPPPAAEASPPPTSGSARPDRGE